MLVSETNSRPPLTIMNALRSCTSPTTFSGGFSLRATSTKKIMMKDEDMMILMYVFCEECVHQEEENSDRLAGLLLLRG